MSGGKLPTPRPHQQEVLAKWAAYDGNRCLLFHPVGKGKTLCALFMLQQRGITEATLVGIIATFPKWKAEAEKFGIKLECVSHQKFTQEGFEPKYHDLILDECHKLIGDKVFKKAVRITKDITRTVISLSATPNWNKGCLDDKSEILTSKGFKFFKDLKPSDKVAQYHKDGSIDFIHPQRIVCNDFEGELKVFEKNKVEMHMTPDHRVVYKNHVDGLYKGLWRECLAEDFGIGHFAIPTTGLHQDGSYKMTHYDRLQIAVSADAHISQTGLILFSLKKARKIKRLEQLLKHTKHSKVNKRTTKDGVTHFSFRMDDMPKGLHLYKRLEECSAFYAREYIEELALWDGHKDSRGHISFSTTKEAEADYVAGMVAISGLSSRTSIEYRSKRNPNWSDCYTVSVSNKDIITARNQRECFTTRKYKGKVYCVTVPTGMIIARRSKGTPFVTGNSQWFRVLQTLWYRKGGYIDWLYANCNVKANPFSRLPDFVNFKVGLKRFLTAQPFVHVIFEDDDFEIQEVNFPQTTNPQYEKVQQYSLLETIHDGKMMGSVMEKLQTLNTLQYCEIDLDGDGKHLMNLRDDLYVWLRKQPKALVYCNKAKMGKLVALALQCNVITGQTPKKDIEGIVKQFAKGGKHLVVTDVMATGYDEFPEITDTLIIFQDTQDNKQREQLIGRINRGKNKGKANIQKVVFNG